MTSLDKILDIVMNNYVAHAIENHKEDENGKVACENCHLADEMRESDVFVHLMNETICRVMPTLVVFTYPNQLLKLARRMTLIGYQIGRYRATEELTSKLQEK